jgi:manganese/zinc/iron transport system ATP- binding protein
MLVVKNLNVAYQTDLVIQDVSFSIAMGTFAAIIGPNGAGKSTLLKSLVGLIPRVSGVITFDGKIVNAADALIAYVPQRAHIDWTFPITVLEVVLMGCYSRLGFGRRPAQHDIERAYHCLSLVDLVSNAHRPIGKLSGGQQQKVLLARAFMQDAPIYMLDEPLSGIDAHSQESLLNALCVLRSKSKMVLMVHHHIQQISNRCDTVLLFNRSCIGYGPSRDMLVPALLEQTYHHSIG